MTIQQMLLGAGGGGGSLLPTATLLHLENPSTNYNTSNGVWTATVGSNVNFLNYSGNFSVGTDSDGNSYLAYPSSNSSSYGALNISLPSNMCIISVIEEYGSQPFIIEHSTDANTFDGMYHYSDTVYPYAVTRSGSTVKYDPSNNAGGIEDPVNSGTKTAFGSNFTSSSNLTNMFYSSKFGGKRNAVLQQGSTITNANTTTDLYIGSRAGSGIMFTGKLYEVYMTNALSSSDFDKAIAYFEAKFNL
tara:strand:+ start:918 stop:1655 length:738 start_codon:yes stop_codon:yes gene_type:complete